MPHPTTVPDPLKVPTPSIDPHPLAVPYPEATAQLVTGKNPPARTTPVPARVPLPVTSPQPRILGAVRVAILGMLGGGVVREQPESKVLEELDTVDITTVVVLDVTVLYIVVEPADVEDVENVMTVIVVVPNVSLVEDNDLEEELDDVIGVGDDREEELDPVNDAEEIDGEDAGCNCDDEEEDRGDKDDDKEDDEVKVGREIVLLLVGRKTPVYVEFGIVDEGRQISMVVGQHGRPVVDVALADKTPPYPVSKQ